MKRTLENTNNLFDGQEFNIGLDVHKKNFKVNIRNNGRELKTFSVDSDSDELRRYMDKNYPGGKSNK